MIQTQSKIFALFFLVNHKPFFLNLNLALLRFQDSNNLIIENSIFSNNTVFQSPDIITLDSALVNITGTLGDTDITQATVKTANINQLTSSNITLLNTPSYSIEQQFISTSGGPFNTISSATNLILSTSMALTATTASENDFIPNYNITINNIDYWASTINIYSGSAINDYNFLNRLINGRTGQLTYRNNGYTTFRITDNDTFTTYTIPPTCIRDILGFEIIN